MSDVPVAAQATDEYAAEIARLSGDTVPEKVEPTIAEPVEPIAKAVEQDIFDPSTLTGAAKAQWDATQKALETERRRAQDFEERFSRLHGKMSPLQKELDRLKARPNQPRPAVTAPPAKAEPPASRETPLQRWTKHKETYGDEAAAIEELIESVKRDEQGRYQSLEQRYAALEQKLSQITDKELPEKFQLIERIQQERENEFIAKAQGSVLETHPDWNEHIQLEETGGQIKITHVSEAMQAWLDNQPDRIVEMFGSDDPKECIWVMNQFKRDQAKPEPQVDSSQQTAATELQAKREKNLQSRAVSSTLGTGMARVDPSKMSDADRYALDMQKLTG